MRKLTYYIIILLLLATVATSCSKAVNGDLLSQFEAGIAVEKLSGPADGQTILLGNSQAEIFRFEWEPVQVEYEVSPRYEVIFSKESGESSRVLYRLKANENGAANYVSVSHKVLNEIANLFAVDDDEMVEFKWAVVSAVGDKKSLSLQSREIRVVRYKEIIPAKSLKVVVLGSSSAVGIGASNPSQTSWVAKYASYLKSINENYELLNLGVSGTNTYHIMPNGHSVSGRPVPDHGNNITRALNYNPDVIIVNMPSNDVFNENYSYNETMANYATLKSIAENAGVQIYFTTTQPRNNGTHQGEEQRQRQIQIKDGIIANFPGRYIDFWTGIAEGDGRIKPLYDYDNIHVNDAGHDILYQQVVATSSILGHAKVIGSEVYASTGKILIDFGGTNTITQSPNWNNVTGPRQVGTTYAVHLRNTEDQRTPFRIYVHDSFNLENYEGVPVGQTGGATGEYPNVAAGDSFYGNTAVFESRKEPTGGVTLDRLDEGKLYSFTFFAGRRSVGDVRTAKYTVIGKTTETIVLNASNNTTNTVSVEDIEPVNGRIIIEVTYGDDNTNGSKFYYLGVLDIDYKPNPGL